MQLIDGKKISLEIQEEIRLEVEKLVKETGRKPHLAAVLIGHDGGSETYVAAKMKACENVGFESSLIRFPESISEMELLEQLRKLNSDQSLDGYIVQLPLPKHIAEKKVIEAIDPKKDVDGFHPVNVGNMALNMPAYLPATPFGIIELLKRYKIETEGKHCVIIGRSHIVGAPMSMLMMRSSYPGNATVTVCHSKTKNISEITRQADILIAAIGKPEFVTADMVKEGAVVIDVGTTRVKDETKKSGFRLSGDVKFDEVSAKASYITPVPGGVGPMTIASLLHNTLLAARKEIYGRE